jgi:dynein light intermediate chain
MEVVEGSMRESLVEYLEPSPAVDDASKGGKKAKKSSQLTEVLHAILPARQYRSSDGLLLKQDVSSTASSREDVINLQMKLDERLQERQARENGICPVREELYSQGFDELIRQVTIESPERGLLLLRVRDEVRMTIAAYQTLYQSSITFGMRKTLQAEQGNSELLAKMEELETEKSRLQVLVQDHRGLYDSIEKRIAEKRAINDKKQLDEKEFLKQQAAHLEKFIQDTNGH